ncbi:hypothetical protein D1B17_08770 [Companilactobacillus zhachilii]|uniref:Uncharacterized protein n=1 Tax=Companilactobacillus zhachilii TaxID=2304606 RepID=A0A386PW83_9LACO|nr:hypothetical protein [Companilactobacillus zhachilii]AYE38717.1 hypothetical protein D1B17_08770 [Companilactobacillus zhachilii]
MAKQKNVSPLEDGPTLINCGRYKAYEIVGKYGIKAELPDNYKAIILPNHMKKMKKDEILNKIQNIL